MALTEGDKCAETDHADPRCDALIPTKARTGSEQSADRRGERNDNQVCQRVQRNGYESQYKELSDNMPELWADELRQEREKEERRLRVKHLCQDSLPEDVQLRGRSCREIERLISGTNHPNANPDQVSCPGEFDDSKCRCRSDQQSGEPDGCGKDVNETAEERAERREKPFATTARQCSAQDVEDAGTGRGGEDQRRSDEESEKTGINHRKLYRARR